MAPDLGPRTRASIPMIELPLLIGYLLVSAALVVAAVAAYRH
ncbi:hypothetical protein ACO229_06800 [Promicromonospora sp. MS192]